jgi:PAS domain S-box-containing protein
MDKFKRIFKAKAIADQEFMLVDCDDAFLEFLPGNSSAKSVNLRAHFPELSHCKPGVFCRLETNQTGEYLIRISMFKMDSHVLNVIDIADDLTVSELEKQVSYLNHQQYLCNEMLNKLDDGIYITDELGKTLYVNDAFENLSGLTRDDLIGRNVQDLKIENTLPNSCCERVIQTRRTVTTINNYYQGQKCLVTGSMISDEQGEFKRTIAVVRDVSELDLLMKKVAKEETLSLAFTKNMGNAEGKSGIPEAVVSNNASVKDIYDKAKRLADIDTTVLILGETGVGKDFLATYIHTTGIHRRDKNMIKVNCAAIPEHLIESELFGYESGAFTGANKHGKKGLFEEAGNGTLFLDEIGDMPYTMQVKLLNALNDKKFYRIGGAREILLNARIIAATNADIRKLVKEKRFRADLYYRLNVISLEIPPLRKRKEDIIPLAQHFLEYYNNKYRKNSFFSPRCLQNFLIYQWPGNIREMKNLIERLTLMSEDVCIDVDLLTDDMGSDIGMIDYQNLPAEDEVGVTLKEKLENHERRLLEEELTKRLTMKESARNLGIDVSTLVRKKQKFNL